MDGGNRGAGYTNCLNQAVRCRQYAVYSVYLRKPPLAYHIQQHLSTTFRLFSASPLVLFNKRSPSKKEHSCIPLSQDTTVLLFTQKHNGFRAVTCTRAFSIERCTFQAIPRFCLPVFRKSADIPLEFPWYDQLLYRLLQAMTSSLNVSKDVSCRTAIADCE